MRGKEQPTIHLNFDNRPVVAVCGCGKLLRGHTRTLPADRVYAINGEKTCRKCALKWFDYNYEMTDVL